MCDNNIVINLRAAEAMLPDYDHRLSGGTYHPREQRKLETPERDSETIAQL